MTNLASRTELSNQPKYKPDVTGGGGGGLASANFKKRKARVFVVNFERNFVRNVVVFVKHLVT